MPNLVASSKLHVGTRLLLPEKEDGEASPDRDAALADPTHDRACVWTPEGRICVRGTAH